MNRLAVALVAGFALPGGLRAGAYMLTVDCRQQVGSFCAQGRDTNGDEIGKFAIVHPPLWDGSQSVLTVNVCVDPAFPLLVAPTQRAIATWNAVAPITGNCLLCILPEDGGPEGPLHAESFILHELGHCALGVDHPNLKFSDPGVGFVDTSYSMAYEGAQEGVLVGADMIRGSRDDFFDDLFGKIAENVHWFREDDNDPFVVDGAPIDINSFSINIIDKLPAGSTWAANANRCHALQLGLPPTQSVMYSEFAGLTAYTGLAADDANMVKMGMTGEDRVIGGGDDYTVQLNYVEDCAEAQVLVFFSSLPAAVGGQCEAAVEPSLDVPPPPVGHLHYTLIPFDPAGEGTPNSHLFVELNVNKQWDYSPPGALIFGDGFESGDISNWDDSVPDDPEVPEGDPHPYDCPIEAASS